MDRVWTDDKMTLAAQNLIDVPAIAIAGATGVPSAVGACWRSIVKRLDIIQSC
jgi:uncharacterized membrane protein SpoIIM required for sporulation